MALFFFFFLLNLSTELHHCPLNCCATLNFTVVGRIKALFYAILFYSHLKICLSMHLLWSPKRIRKSSLKSFDWRLNNEAKTYSSE